MKELLEKTINNYWNKIDEEGTYKTFCEIYEKTGDEEAEFYMGKMLYQGIGTEKNWEKAYQIMEKLYDKDRKAREVIADMYYTGKYLEEDDNKAFELYTQLVADGEDSWGYSTFMLGMCYLDGVGTEVNYEKAFELIKKAAELGYKDAYYELGCMYLYGIGTEKNDKEVIKWLTKGVEKEDKDAQAVLGALYFEGKEYGIDIKEDKKYGLELLLKVAENRKNGKYRFTKLESAIETIEVLAIKGEKCVIDKLKELVEDGKDTKGYYSYFLGKCFTHGYGVEKDHKKSFELLKSAVELGCDEACFLLGGHYKQGEGTEVNYEKAVEMYQRVVEWNKYAQYSLGELYLKGKEYGVNIEENKEYGLELIIKSAGAGHEEAIVEIELLARKGEKCVIEKLKELVEAEKDTKGYYSYILGECYKYEEGVEKDLTKAFEYYKSAVELGCDKACLQLGMAYLGGNGTEENHGKAIELLERAVKWSLDAQYILGMLYLEGKENGVNIEANKEYGLELIKKAAESGDEEAINKIKELEEKDNDSQLDKNVNYFEKGVEEFKKGNYEQAEKEFENDKKIFLSENRDYKSKGNPYLAFMYYYGIGKKVDYEKAWKECNNVIEVAVRFEDYRDTEQVNNNIISHYLVGKMLNNGEGVEKDVDKALRQFKFIADEYKIKELIKEDYLFNIILNEYKETEAQYVYSLIYGPSATKEKFEEKDKVENN